MNDEWRLTAFSVTKYNPIYRNENGEYSRSEWTSYSDLGKIFDGKQLTIRDYLKVEEKYKKFAEWFFNYHNIERVIVANLEKPTLERQTQPPEEYLKNLYLEISDMREIPISKISSVVELILRSYVWAELLSNKTPDIAIRFGYDYYMYFNTTNNNLQPIKDQAKNLGLFID